MELVVRATIMFWFLWVLLRIAGKRELAEVTPFELIVLMVMGDLIQQGVTQEDMSLTGAALSVSTIMLWTIGLSYLNYRNRRLARVLESEPTILVTDGSIDTRMLEIHRITVDAVLDEARNSGIHDIADVDYAVLESDGKISFLHRSNRPSDQQSKD